MRMKSFLALSLFALSSALSTAVVAEQNDVVYEPELEQVEAQEQRRFLRWWPSFTPAFGACCWDDQNFFLGFEFAFARQRSVFTTDFVAPILPPPIDFYVHYDATIVVPGFFTGIMGGWQARFQRFMAGLELNFDYPTMFNRQRQFTFQDYSLTNAHWFAGTVVYDRGPILGLTTRWGYFVTPGFFPYVRIGGQMSRDTAMYKVTEGISALGPVHIPGFTEVSSRKRTILGIVAGAGVEFPALIGPSTVRLEYNFTQSQNFVITDNVLPILGTHNFHEAQNNVFKVAWVWNFV